MRHTPNDWSDTQLPQAVAVDGHVHFQPVFELQSFLDAAARNLSAARLHGARSGSGPDVLLLAESGGAEFFSEWHRAAASELHTEHRWSLRTSPEPESILAFDDGEPKLWLIAGAQIQVGDGLELLALGTRERFPDGMGMARTLEAVRRAEALAVMPWSLGAYWFRRGRTLEKLLRLMDGESLFLGDSGNRYRLPIVPRHFRVAAQQGIRVLPGSDSLPFPSQLDGVGACGFLVPGGLEPHRPAASLKERLRHPSTAAVAFGDGPSLVDFVRNQLTMLWRRRRQASTSRRAG